MIEGPEKQVVFADIGQFRQTVQRLFAVEGPDDPPALGGGIGIDLHAARNGVFIGDVDALAVGRELPVVVGALHGAVDQAALRQIGADMRAIGALHDRLSIGAAIDDHPRAKEILADDLPCRKVIGEHQRVPVFQVRAVVLLTVNTAGKFLLRPDQGGRFELSVRHQGSPYFLAN